MFERLGTLFYRHSRLVLALTTIFVIAAAALGFGAFGKLSTGGFTDPDAESSLAAVQLETEFGGESNLVLVVEANDGTVDDPVVVQAGAELTEALRRNSRSPK